MKLSTACCSDYAVLSKLSGQANHAHRPGCREEVEVDAAIEVQERAVVGKTQLIIVEIVRVLQKML